MAHNIALSLSRVNTFPHFDSFVTQTTTVPEVTLLCRRRIRELILDVVQVDFVGAPERESQLQTN